MHKSPFYMFTVDADNQNQMSRIDDLKKVVRAVNKMEKKTSANPTSYRVFLSGRLGRNNPRSIDYRSGQKNYGTIRKDDAVRFDVYIYMKHGK